MEELSAVILLQRILDDAVARSASDVHLHVVEGDLNVMFRVNGGMEPFVRVPDPAGTVVRRIKALARLDVSETRVPQDGAFQWVTDAAQGEEGQHCDVRVAVVPTVGGETAVLRLFVRGGAAPSLADLGLTAAQLAVVRGLLRSASGMILVAGSTGSGKTTTLYAMLQALAAEGRRVVSIEDPVEMHRPEWQQMEVRERLGVTFDVGVRAVLRQDPDVIMIGEIRDEATARAALRAAMTGHLVLTTTHAHDLVGAAARLVDLGLARESLGDVLRGVVLQALVHADCALCTGQGCDACAGTGRGNRRKAVFQIEPMDPVFAARLASGASWAELRGWYDTVADNGGTPHRPPHRAPGSPVGRARTPGQPPDLPPASARTPQAPLGGDA
ncbi:Flp pilus assembly complex ATPase component TadA [Alicyclobacillus cycloheptanicus]|uniref:Type II secretory ATPase GspE/PulE/Tfp pilus assembly ATPase PilB-like protein n=1 Tax=Alicyclobacillus cycloheptanicus TaxID=1457 RepID=A0ABT9XDF0_9BACL|nr:ATPase, T2SS/T4P/T4SS family [Alicyclobacillus cycloheptanicus]MDQ0188331.1 type II secretory ATPase GspE/PulE/Tfp pilus assembly ATPase PilB-like protein [Alicyclobacillus cycloheptanicus]WDM01045.1 Flp pilus assembly complex ATPase component TadA [Alicyclobacillus cycloheptanicus]